jgi:DNA-binding CsgD family transcriptional regulator
MLHDTDRAVGMTAGLREMSRRQPTPTLRGIHDLCRGLLTGDADLLLAAEESFKVAGRRLYQAYALENAAVLLADSGRTAPARVALTTALEHYDHLDAGWDAGRARARLRGYGIRSRRTAVGQRPKSGWDSLTDTERRVTALVAEGRSNPDIAASMFISRRTVQSHVSSILTKLGRTSRVELAVAAAARRHPPD